MNRLIFTMSFLTFSAVAAATGSAADPTFSDMAKARPQVSGAPLASDVCLSSRWRHPRNADDPYDTFATGDAFHATRLDWVYSSDAKWIKACRDQGYHFGATLNTILTDKTGPTREQGRLRNKKGERITAPWMRSFGGAWWGCVNSPAYREVFLIRAKAALDGGAAIIHVDDPGMNATAVRWGACHCEHCQTRAKAQKIDLNDRKQMRSFQRASVEAFYKDMRKQIDEHAGRRVVFSSNNYGGNWGWPYALFDFGISEFKRHEPDALYARVVDARKHKKNQVFTLGSRDVRANRLAIATSYAIGSQLIVPWDVWMHGSPKRYYGKSSEYADLFGFVRSTAAYLDGYGEAAVTGWKLPDTKAKLVEIDGEKTIALVRAKPKASGSPVVIHVVDYQPDAGRTLKISQAALGLGDQIKATLYTPVAFDAKVHATVIEAAKQARGEQMRGPKQAAAFAPLRQAQTLEPLHHEGQFVMQLPKAAMWGIVVIESAGEKVNAAPPLISFMGLEKFEGKSFAVMGTFFRTQRGDYVNFIPVEPRAKLTWTRGMTDAVKAEAIKRIKPGKHVPVIAMCRIKIAPPQMAPGRPPGVTTGAFLGPIHTAHVTRATYLTKDQTVELAGKVIEDKDQRTRYLKRLE